ncbi:MAG TPA: hypothetical protein VFH73_19975 [Polyangia bacterium]|nr:hypothetical protein [Polyangia bacterium]
MAVPLLAVSAEPLVTDAVLGDEADILLRSLGQLRGIPARGALPRQLLGPAELRAEMNAIVARHDFPAERETTRLIGARLGLLPAGSGYSPLLADALGAQPGSFYDPLSRRLYVPNWIDLPNQRIALAHELAHALCDQRFGLRRVLGLDDGARPGRESNSDRRRARQALIEGDAATLTLELFDPKGALLSARELSALVQRLRVAAAAAPPAAAATDAGPPPPPPLVRQLLAFPAVEGLAFVGRVRNRQPWTAIDAIWARPPDSTEQILHPEKYDRGEPPVIIEVAPLPALAPGHRLAGTDTLGELMVRLWLARSTSAAVAERAAEGWAGDRIAVYVPAGAASATSKAATPTEAVLAWLTVWDSAADAEDFAITAAEVLAALSSPTTPPSQDTEPQSSSPVVFRDADGKLFALARRADRVALLLGAPEPAVAALDQMLTQWRVPGPPQAPAKLKPPAPAPTKPPPRPRPRR